MSIFKKAISYLPCFPSQGKEENSKKMQHFLDEIKLIFPNYPTIDYKNDDDYRKKCSICLELFQKITR